MNVYTHPYNLAYTPPFPEFTFSLSAPGGEEIEVEITALIDSGADGSMIPLNVLQQVNAQYLRKVQMRGVLGTVMIVDTYLVSLQINNHTISGVQVIAVETGNDALIGRDVLNHMVVTLNGLALVTEISA